jgi:D-alanyl-D-alanine carboxypeptidase/D-alanyl-D-alanine-endopeptidase (penicillin-binding protein 4)
MMIHPKYILIACISIALLSACKTKTSTVAGINKHTPEQQSVALFPKAIYIDSLINTLPEGSEVGISIYNLTKNKVVYRYRDKKLSRPASTMKLLTTITTLSYPEGRLPFNTEVWYSGRIANDTLKGDIYVKGCMDPEFDDTAMDSLVAQVAKLPFKVLSGHIVGDISMKDSLYWGEGWMWDDAPFDYQPQLSPLMYNKGVINIIARPDSIQQKAIISTIPNTDYCDIENNTQSIPSLPQSFDVSRNYINQSNHIVASGNVNSRKVSAITVSYVQNYFLHTFAQRLEKKGNKKILYGYRSTTSPTIDYNTLIKIASYATDCSSVVKQLLKKSDNLNAEAMFYRLSAINGYHPATAKGGTEAIKKLIREMKFNPDSYLIVDGSGLSNYDNLSPELEVAFLRYTYKHPDIYNIIYPSLPIAGIDGSLSNRMKNSAATNNVHAKTGSYTAINALAGYLTTSTGDKLAFSIMNQSILDSQIARDFQDAICTMLCQ